MRKARIWIVLHKYVGLTAGAVIAFAALTGSILVFDHAIDEWLNRELLLPEKAHDAQLDWDRLIAQARSACDGREARLTSLEPPRKPGASVVGFCEGPAGPFYTYVNPRTAEILGFRGEVHLMSVVYELHYSLLAGRSGAIFIGCMGILCLFLVVTGVYLWIPRLSRARLKEALTVQSRFGRPRLILDLHRTPGFYLSIVVFVLALTGTYLTFPGPFDRAVTAIASDTDDNGREQELRSVSRGETRASLTRPISLGLANIKSRLPEATVSWFSFSDDGSSPGVYQVEVRLPNEPGRSTGKTNVWLDRKTRDIVAVEEYASEPAAGKLEIWMFILHNGEALGLFGRWLVFLSGLIITALFGTGLWYWLIKRQARAR